MSDNVPAAAQPPFANGVSTADLTISGTSTAGSDEVDHYIAGNRAYFDKDSHKYDDRPSALKLARKVGEYVATKYAFDEDATILLDYACGTGLVSRELAPLCKKIVGVDVSQGMVDVYNTRVANQGIDAEEMKAVCVELNGSEDELDGVKFDVALCSMAYHHFKAIEPVTKTLAKHLKPGGRLMVVDIISDPTRESFFDVAGHDHDHGDSSHAHHGGHEHHHHQDDGHHTHGVSSAGVSTKAPENATPADDEDEDFPIPPENVVAHKGGFIRERIETVFSDAGLSQLDWSILGDFQPLRGKGTVQLFLAIGVKA